jgi:uncharacterized Zn finger protein
VTTERASDKAVRLLADGRVSITTVAGDRVAAVVHGDTGRHEVGHDLLMGWHCTCPTRGTACSHLMAVQRVTATSDALA